MLAGARVRNSDLPTSLSVLRTGNYSRLPSIIVEGFSQPERLSDEVVLKTLEELDGVLRWRLGCREQLPRGMSRYWIADGRAYFTVEGMWEASFTFGGGEDDEDDSPSKPEAAQASTEEGASPPPPVPPEEPNLAQWFLLSLKFLFRVRDARGGESRSACLTLESGG